MVSKEYLGTAITLLRIARSVADETIADRLRVLAEHYERLAQKAGLAESAAPAAVRGNTAGRFGST
jgi:hypothetical protein